MEQYIEKLPDHLCFQGNLDPMILVNGGGLMKERIRYILKQMRNKNFIFNLGHGVIKETPVEHVKQLVSEVREFTK